MKIASVTFFPYVETIGGGQIPSIAFSEWCDIFEIDCDIIGVIDERNISGRHFSNEINIFIDQSRIELLNEYDAIFFSTPIINCDFDINKIRKPFITMIHGENDINMYSKDYIAEMIIQKYSKGTVHINARKYFDNPSSLYWHPCCSPNDLISGDIKKRDGGGLLYAARITEWLNPELFLYVANNMINQDDNYMFGNCLDEKLLKRINKDKGCVKLSSRPFKRGTVYEPNTSFFWDVAGCKNRSIEFNRISLSAYEALKNGYMPIVQIGTAPKMFRENIFEIDKDKIHINKIIGMLCVPTLQNEFDNLSEIINSSYLGYSGVSYQVKRLLRKLGVDI